MDVLICSFFSSSLTTIDYDARNAYAASGRCCAGRASIMLRTDEQWSSETGTSSAEMLQRL